MKAPMHAGLVQIVAASPPSPPLAPVRRPASPTIQETLDKMTTTFRLWCGEDIVDDRRGPVATPWDVAKH